MRASLGPPLRRRRTARAARPLFPPAPGGQPHPAAVEARVLACRHRDRRGPAYIADQTGVPERTVFLILRRHQVPRLADCDPLTGTVIRARRITATRYERGRSGELITWMSRRSARSLTAAVARSRPRRHRRTAPQKTPIGFDYVHTAIDDHSHLAYAEILPDESR